MLLRKLYYGFRSFRTVHYSQERLKSFQFRLLDRLIQHAYDHVPFYRERWEEAGFSPEEFDAVDDMDKIPIIDAYEFRPHIGDLQEAFDEGIGGIAESSGSGGHGTLEAAFDTVSFDWMEAIHMRGLMLQGYLPGKSQSHYSHEAFDGGIGRRLIAPKKRVKTTWPPERQLEALEEHGSPYLVFFPHPLFTLAKKKIQSERDYRISPDLILTGGEVLTPAMRRTIEHAFDSTVRDHYQTNEVIQIGWECPDTGGYHVAADSVLVDVVDRNGQQVAPGEAGDIVVTGLVNKATPIIRYNLGDIGVRGENNCACDTDFPVIESLNGRKNDVVEDAAGNAVFPSQIIDLLAQYPDLLRFRFIEDEGGNYRVHYIPNRGFSPETLEDARDAFEQKLDLSPVTFEEVETIDTTENGKMRPVVSQQEHPAPY